MTSYKLFSLAAFLLIYFISAEKTIAQCGTTVSASQISFEQQFQQAFSNRNSLSSAPVSLKLSVYILKNGSLQAASEGLVRQAVEQTNLHFDSIDIRFDVCSFTYIDDAGLFAFTNDEEDTLYARGHTDSTINVYITGSLAVFTPPSTYTTVCGYAYYPSALRDVIVLGGSCLSSGTLTHELGHFFNLYHTHETSLGAELVNGSNCSTAGDVLCDTPADPLLSTSNVNTSCTYTGSATDSNGDPYTPGTHFIMSYGRTTCLNTFSPQQFVRMRFAYDNYKSYLKTLNYSYVQTDTTICPGQFVDLGINNTNGTNFDWSTGDTIPLISVSPGTTHFYNLTFNSSGCTLSKNYTITVLPSASVSSGASTLCPGNNTSVITVSGTSTALSYQLMNNSLPVGAAQAGNGGTLNFPAGTLNATTTFSVIATSAVENCSFITGTKTLNVTPNPNLNISILPTPDSICSNSSVAFKIYPSEFGITYQVYHNGTPVNSQTAGGNGDTLAITNASITATGWYTVKAVNSCGTFNITDSAYITVMPYPAIVTATLIEDTVCKGFPSGFQIDTSEAGINYSVSGPSSAVITLGTGSTVIAYSSPITSNVNLILTAITQFGCSRRLLYNQYVNTESAFADIRFVNGVENYMQGDTVLFRNFSNADHHQWTIYTDSLNSFTDTAEVPQWFLAGTPGHYAVYYAGASERYCMDYDTLFYDVLPAIPSATGSFCMQSDTCDGALILDVEQDPCGNTIFAGAEPAAGFQSGSGYLAKLDPQGNKIWEINKNDIHPGNLGACLFTGAASDDQGNVYACGHYFGDALEIQGFQSYTSTLADFTRPFMIKVNSAGQVQWMISGENRTGSTLSMDFFTSVKISPTGSVFLSYAGQGYLDIQFTDTLLYLGQATPFVLLEIDTAGNLIRHIDVNTNQSFSHITNAAFHYFSSASPSTTGWFALSPEIDFTSQGKLIYSGVVLGADSMLLTFDSTHTLFADSVVKYFFAVMDTVSGWESIHVIAQAEPLGCKDMQVEIDSQDNIVTLIHPYSDYCHGFGYSPLIIGQDTVTTEFTSGVIKTDLSGNIIWKRLNPYAFAKSFTVTPSNDIAVFYINYQVQQFIEDGIDTVVFSSPYLGSGMITTYNDAGHFTSFKKLNGEGQLHGYMDSDENGDIITAVLSKNWTSAGPLVNVCGNIYSSVFLRYAPSGLCGVPGCIDSLSVHPEISIDAIAPLDICAGDSILVTYHTSDITFNAGNAFIFTLSDALGMTGNGVVLDSVHATSGGQMMLKIPDNTVEGSLYKIRISSTQPYYNGLPSTRFTVHAPHPQLNANNVSVWCGNYPDVQWYFNGTMLPGETDTVLNWMVTGLYSAVVSDAYGCTGWSDTLMLVHTGLTGVSALEAALYPNPADELTTLLTSWSERIEITLISVAGQKVFSKIIPPGNKSTMLDLERLSEGIYLLQLKAESELRTIRLVRQ